MVDSWIESFVQSYYQSFKKFLVQKNIWFRVEKKDGVRKQANWSDIDILALSSESLFLVSCKSFLGAETAEKSVQRIKVWFGEATEFVENHEIYKKLIFTKKFPLVKELVLEVPHKKAEALIKEQCPEINIFRYKDMLVEWIDFLKSEMIDSTSKGKYITPAEKVYKKTDDHIERLLMELIRYKIIS